MNLCECVNVPVAVFVCDLCYLCSSDVKLECFSKSKLESKKSIKTRNSFLIVS